MTTTQQTPKTSTRKLPPTVFRRLFSFFVWTYIVTKLFIFDVDSWLLGILFPDQPNMASYRFIAFLATAVLLFLALGLWRFVLLALYVAFFPIIVVTWTIPKSLYRSNNLFWVFTYINTVINAFRPIRRRLVSLLFLFLAVAIVLRGQNRSLLIIGCGLAALFMVMRLVTQTQKAFQPMTFLAVKVDVFVKFLKSEGFQKGLSKFIEDTSKETSTNGAADTKTPTSQNTLMVNKRSRKLSRQKSRQHGVQVLKLQNLIIYNRAALLLATNIKKYQEEKVYMMFIVVDSLATILMAIFCFALINLGIYKIDPMNFDITVEPSIFNFFYYSFSATFANQVAEISSSTLLTRTLFIVESFVIGIYGLAVIVSIFAAIKSERYDKDLKSLIESLKEQGRDVEKQLKTEFNVNTVEHGIDLLRDVQNSSIKLIVWLTGRIDI